ncbi:hypothetical protein ACISU4_34255, partial [Streptomyces wuyuanensis]
MSTEAQRPRIPSRPPQAPQVPASTPAETTTRLRPITDSTPDPRAGSVPPAPRPRTASPDASSALAPGSRTASTTGYTAAMSPARAGDDPDGTGTGPAAPAPAPEPARPPQRP